MTESSGTGIALLPDTGSGPHGRLGVRLSSASASKVVGTLPLDEAGAGGSGAVPAEADRAATIVAFAQLLAAVGAARHAGARRRAVILEVSALRHGEARGLWVHGVATALHLDAELAAYEVVVCDDTLGRVCTARVTCQVRRS